MHSRPACPQRAEKSRWTSNYKLGCVSLREVGMNNGQIRDLCISLLHAETEDEAIDLLKRAGFWDQPALWRHYGDLENNWGQGGNQQSLAEAALVEKIVNSVDARLINECLERKIDPKGADAPKSI